MDTCAESLSLSDFNLDTRSLTNSLKSPSTAVNSSLSHNSLQNESNFCNNSFVIKKLHLLIRDDIPLEKFGKTEI